MSRCVIYQSGGFTNYGISYRKYSQEELSEMKNRAITEKHTDMKKHCDEEVETCKWIKYDYRTICPKEHDADNPYWRIPENMDKLKYCPYCGKEIRVVEN